MCASVVAYLAVTWRGLCDCFCFHCQTARWDLMARSVLVGCEDRTLPYSEAPYLCSFFWWYCEVQQFAVLAKTNLSSESASWHSSCRCLEVELWIRRFSDITYHGKGAKSLWYSVDRMDASASYIFYVLTPWPWQSLSLYPRKVSVKTYFCLCQDSISSWPWPLRLLTMLGRNME